MALGRMSSSGLLFFVFSQTASSPSFISNRRMVLMIPLQESEAGALQHLKIEVLRQKSLIQSAQTALDQNYHSRSKLRIVRYVRGIKQAATLVYLQLWSIGLVG